MFKKKNIQQLTDAQLVERAKVNHRQFGELYERYFEIIFSFVFKRLGGDENNAADLTQQTFIKAMSNIKEYEDRGYPFSSWLYRIAQNEINQFYRNAKKITTIEIEQHQLANILEEANLSHHITIENQEQLMELLNNLPQENSDLIELRFFQDLSFKEIAAIYEITEANAKMRIYRILEKMNKNWQVKS